MLVYFYFKYLLFGDKTFQRLFLFHLVISRLLSQSSWHLSGTTLVQLPGPLKNLNLQHLPCFLMLLPSSKGMISGLSFRSPRRLLLACPASPGFLKRNWNKLCFLMISAGFTLRYLISVPRLDSLYLPRNTKNVLLSFDLDPHPSLASNTFSMSSTWM